MAHQFWEHNARGNHSSVFCSANVACIWKATKSRALFSVPTYPSCVSEHEQSEFVKGEEIMKTEMKEEESVCNKKHLV